MQVPSLLLKFRYILRYMPPELQDFADNPYNKSSIDLHSLIKLSISCHSLA